MTTKIMAHLHAFFLRFYLFFVNFIHEYNILHHIQSHSFLPSSQVSFSHASANFRLFFFPPFPPL